MEFYKNSFSKPFNQLIKSYYLEAQIAQQSSLKEDQAAVLLQSKFKMFVLRKYYLKYREASVLIQKFVRGLISRQRAKRYRSKKLNELNERFFNNQAILIQKCFRGFYKRKYYHEFKARKNYLNFLKQKNYDFKNELEDFALQESLQRKIMEEKVAREEFNKIARNLHHLSSTKTITGVYSSKPGTTAFNMDVDSHLKSLFHESFKKSIRYNQDDQMKSPIFKISKTQSLSSLGSQKIKQNLQSLNKLKPELLHQEDNYYIKKKLGCKFNYDLYKEAQRGLIFNQQ